MPPWRWRRVRLGVGREAWLKGWRPVRNRSSVCNGPRAGVRWLNDAYNANADSVRASLEALAALGNGRRFVVLGEMAELGSTLRMRTARPVH